MRRFPVFLLVTSLALAACGSNQVTIDGSPPPPAATATNSADAPDEYTGGSDAGAPPSRSDTTVPKKTGPRSPSPLPSGPADHNSMPLTVSLNRSCVQPGQEMQATAVTEPSSKLAFAASYADNDMVPDFTYTPAESNPTGTFTWTWVIRPNIPPGESLVTVVAAKDDRGASFEHPFRVAASC